VVCDRGFLITLSAFRAGGQIVIQPAFSKPKQRFTDRESGRSAMVAGDRSGNERAVRFMKLSGYVSQGKFPNECVDRLSDVWLCWGFQTNFMYRPTL
jgi:hypothetical protein